jgi:hypothetical protein
MASEENKKEKKSDTNFIHITSKRKKHLLKGVLIFNSFAAATLVVVVVAGFSTANFATTSASEAHLQCFFVG